MYLYYITAAYFKFTDASTQSNK